MVIRRTLVGVTIATFAVLAFPAAPAAACREDSDECGFIS